VPQTFVFYGTKAFMKVVKRRDAFLIYIFASLDVESCPYEISSYYQEFKYVFEKKNVNTLLKH
jgi:hypothetical protein